MLYTSPGRGQNKVARVQDLQGKRRKTRSSHTIISISALNTYNNANFDFSLVALRPVFSVLLGQGNVYTGQGRTSVTSTWHWNQITVFQGIGL